MEREGVGQAKGEFGECWLEEVPVNVEGEVAVVIADERVNESELVDQYDRDRQEKQIGCQRVP